MSDVKKSKDPAEEDPAVLDGPLLDYAVGGGFGSRLMGGGASLLDLMADPILSSTASKE
ncbi:MAG: hypothetical protein AAF415_07855 [Pseudomonadota bacterium]